jgi:hypothetical protein
VQIQREQTQAHVPARNAPLQSTHQSSASWAKENNLVDSAQYSSEQSSRAAELGLASNETFAYSSFQETIEELPHEPRKEPPVNPGEGAPRAEMLEYIRQQLDCYGKEPLLRNRYQLLGPAHRATGGAFYC